MIRKVHITLAPSAALTALVTLRADAQALGARFNHEVAREFESHARSLDALGQCLDWLDRRGLAVVARPRARAGQRVHAWQCSVEVHVDVRELSRELSAEEGDLDGRARASAWALRAVLRHLASSKLHTSEVRAGSERLPAAEALTAYDASMATVGFGAHAAPPARLAHLVKNPRRREAASVTSEAPAKPDASRNVPKGDVPKGDVPKAKPMNAGFGALPDDAVPEDRRPGEVYSTRGLTLDAELFLTEAGVAAWPCDAKTLERGRRLVVSKLHPDRAGEASTLPFHRVIKGHAELLKKLVALPAPVVPAPPIVPVVSVVSTASATAFEWPPRPSTATGSHVEARVPVATVKAARARRSA